MTSILKHTISGVVLCLAFLCFATANAQEYPSRTITIINPFPPGGLTEQVARPLAIELEESLGQAVILENKPGAAGAVGAQFGATAKPDGYTILSHIVSVGIFPLVDELLGREQKYTMDDLIPIGRMVADPPILVVNAETPYQTLDDLVADAKSNPDTIIYSSSGPYGALHVPYAMLLQIEGGLDMRHLPERGGGPAMAAVLGNNAQVLAAPVSTASPHIKAGKVRPLAVFGAERLSAFPEVPTLKELGHDIEFYLWSGVFVPKGTPENIVIKLREAVGKAAASERLIETYANQGLTVAYMDQPEFVEFLKADQITIADTLRSIGDIR